MKKRLKKTKGITLISLIITIIILIILAGITMNLILDNNGIMNRAVSAKEQTTIESIRERLELVKGSTYVKELGNVNISKYFAQLDQEKIRPYTVTGTKELNEYLGVVQVDSKYSYLIKFTGNGDMQIEYEGKVGEENREIGEVSVILSGETTQNELPIKLTATITNSKEEVKSAKWILTQEDTKLGTQESNYTESVSSNIIYLQMNEAKTYYLHVLTTDMFGTKVETVKGPITVTSVTHTHIGSSSEKGGCYTIPISHTHDDSCYKVNTFTCPGNEFTYSGMDGRTNQYVYKCTTCGRNAEEDTNRGSHYSAPCGMQRTEKELICEKNEGIIGYDIGCGKTEGQIESYTISY